MDADGIGVNNKRALTTTQPYKTVLLLQPTKQQSDQDADDGTKECNHTTFKKEDARYLFVAGTQIERDPMRLKQAIMRIKVRKI